jgi:drug/metabolite transporter (DMT)-like permease
VTEPAIPYDELAVEALGETTYAPAAPRKRSVNVTADLALLLVALIWGSTFVMVKDAVAAYPVFGFLAIRFTIAALVVAPFLVIRRRRPPGVEPQRKKPAEASTPSNSGVEPFLAPTGQDGVGGHPATSSAPFLQRNLPPLLIGLALFTGYAFQTFGLSLTTPAKAGFITGLSVVLVPIGSALLLRQRPERAAWLGVGLATVGLALLSLDATLTVSPGDLLVMGCAVSFAAHILLMGRYAPGHDPVHLLFGQLAVVAVLSTAASLLFEQRPSLSNQVLFAAAFTGLFATVIAFGVQTVAQRFTSATHTALIFATEPVFAAIFSVLLTGEALGPKELLGCALILAGMVVAEVLPLGRRAPAAQPS